MISGAFTSVATTNSIGGLILDEFMPPPTELRISGVGFNAVGGFDVTVENFDPGGTTYRLALFDEASSRFEAVVTGFAPAATNDTITDPGPPVGSAIYRVEEE